MNILPLNLPEPAKRWREQRCCHTVESTGTHFFDGNKHRCARMARFEVDGKMYCTQHAGQKALQFMLNQEEL